MPIRVLHVISGLPRAAGTSVFCVELCDHLVARGEACCVAVRQRSADDYASKIGVDVIEWGRRVSSLPFSPDVVHIHALWDPFLHHAAVWARRERVPVVWSLHGMLTPWALRHKAVKKALALAAYQYRDLKTATLFHATAQSEVPDIHRLRLTQPVVVIPLGVELPNEKYMEPRECSGVRTALFISRIHPVKGLFNLVDAWGKLRPTGWKMVIAGPDQSGHAAAVKARAEAKGVGRDFEFVGPVFGEEKTQLYAQADLFVLPTHSENFGVVVAEALAAGVPVITTKGAPWSELLGDKAVSSKQLAVSGDKECENALMRECLNGEILTQRRRDAEQQMTAASHLPAAIATGRCGWWIDIGVEPLAAALREAMGLSDEERQAMGENGRRLVERKYTWEAVAEGMRGAYARLAARKR